MRVRVYAAVVVLLCSLAGVAQSSQLAPTPPMGWNSWNFFGKSVTDKDIRKVADLLVSSGMKDAGYVYVNIDDTWEGERDSKGMLHSNAKFPDMKALADYVHSKGLKFGIYSSPAPKTCGGYEGSMGHEQQDADQFAAWGVDFLKYDRCSYSAIEKQGGADKATQFQRMHAAYERMHQALLKTGRPILYSLCETGVDSVWHWGTEVGGSMWRTTSDIHSSFDRISIVGLEQAGLAKYAGPGHWNDPDMLEVGNGSLTLDEDRLHMGFWAILAAPLIAGNDLSQMTPEVRAILTNKDVIAIDQDPLGRQGDRVYAEGLIEIWARPLANGDVALGIMNFGRDSTLLRDMTLHLKEAGAGDGWNAYDVWGAKKLGRIKDDSKFTLGPHTILLLRLSK